MGQALGYAKATFTAFEKARTVVNTIPSSYIENFNNKYNDVIKLRDKATNENKTIYFEREIPET